MKFTGTLVILDGQPDQYGDVLDPNCEVNFSEKVTVMREFMYDTDHVLGEGILTREPNAIKYELDIDVEKLSKEELKTLTPCIGGKILQRDGRKITCIAVHNIGLSVEGNADSRIKPIGEQK